MASTAQEEHATAGARGVVAHGRYRAAFELLPKSGTVLDYGCGEGQFITAVAALCPVEAHGADIRPEAVAGLDESVTAHHVDENDFRLPFADGALNGISMCDVLEHIPEDARIGVLAEMRRVLRDDGRLVITVPHDGALAWADPENVKFRFPRLHRAVYRTIQRQGQYEEFYGGRHGNYSEGADEHHHFSRAELDRLLASAGFGVTTVRYYSLFEPLLHAGIWLFDGVHNRTGRGKGRVYRALWDLYIKDADRDFGPRSGSIAVAAQPA